MITIFHFIKGLKGSTVGDTSRDCLEELFISLLIPDAHTKKVLKMTCMWVCYEDWCSRRKTMSLPGLICSLFCWEKILNLSNQTRLNLLKCLMIYGLKDSLILWKYLSFRAIACRAAWSTCWTTCPGPGAPTWRPPCSAPRRATLCPNIVRILIRIRSRAEGFPVWLSTWVLNTWVR